MSKELATTNTEFQIAPINEEIVDAIKEELAGLGSITFDAIKIPSGGGLAFEVPSDDPEKPEPKSSLKGIIIYHHPVNAYWADAYTGAKNAPDCVSFDAKNGRVTATGEVRDCATCPFNQFGSDTSGGKGKACKNGHRVYILLENETLPLMLILPPTSIKNLKDYLAKRVLIKGKRSYEVITEFKLAKDKNEGGIAYSKATFSRVGELSKEQVQQILPSVDFVKSIAKEVDFIAEEINDVSENSIDIEVDDEPTPKTVLKTEEVQPTEVIYEEVDLDEMIEE